jgi:hypothetical protein
MAKEFQAGGVSPMEVLQEDNERAGGAEFCEEAADLREERRLGR